MVGSCLWSLDSPAVDSLCASWRRSVKYSWDINWSCHGYFLPTVLAPNSKPLLASLLSRFHNFFLGLLDSPSKEVQILARLSSRDVRSNLGSNLRLIKDKTRLDPWTATNCVVKHKLNKTETVIAPKIDEWRIAFLAKLLSARLEAHYLSNSKEELGLTEMINSLVAN